MSGLGPLADAPQESWGNAILFQLADALGYPSEEKENPEGGDAVRVITAEPDNILGRALETIAKYRELDK